VTFADLLSFQKPPQSLEELHAKITAVAALTPSSRTDFLEECEAKAKELIKGLSQNSENDVQDTYNMYSDEITTLKTQLHTSISNVQNNSLNTLQARQTSGLQQQNNGKDGALSDFTDAMAIPDVLTPLKSATQYDSLTDAVATIPKAALPLRFRILSRANEIYGANNWGTVLPNTAENFYDLLIGTADDVYHSDFEPVQDCFLQGATGDFVCNRMCTELYDYSNANGTAPMAAVGAFAVENTTNEDQSRSINFGLSSYNFASVFLKTDVWTPLFQATSNTYHSSVMTADFVIPANQTATILLVSTPYYYWYSGSRSSPAQTHLLQFLQWNIFGIREMLGDELILRIL
jgi:hypothetical protein